MWTAYVDTPAEEFDEFIRSRWLMPAGRFCGNIDLASITTVDGEPVDREILRHLKAAGITYDVRRRLLSCTGPRDIAFPLTFVGADDEAGPNYTGQPAVDSIYRRRTG